MYQLRIFGLFLCHSEQLCPQYLPLTDRRKMAVEIILNKQAGNSSSGFGLVSSEGRRLSNSRVLVFWLHRQLQ
jgi:hypothetical protein